MFSRVDLCFQEVISVLKTDLIACVRDLKSCRTPRVTGPIATSKTKIKWKLMMLS